MVPVNSENLKDLCKMKLFFKFFFFMPFVENKGRE